MKGRAVGHIAETTPVGRAAPGSDVSVTVIPQSREDRNGRKGDHQKEGWVRSEDKGAGDPKKNGISRSSSSLSPFRITGLSICGACEEMGYGEEYVGRNMNGCRKPECFI